MSALPRKQTWSASSLMSALCQQRTSVACFGYVRDLPAPKLVVDVRYDHVTGGRFRQGTKLLRFRPDKASSRSTGNADDEPRAPAHVDRHCSAEPQRAVGVEAIEASLPKETC